MVISEGGFTLKVTCAKLLGGEKELMRVANAYGAVALYGEVFAEIWEVLLNLPDYCACP